MSSKQVKTSVLLILGGHMECVKPNLSMSSCSDLRQQDEMLVTISFAVKGRTAFLVSFSSFLVCAITKRTKEYRRLLLAWDKLSTQIRDVLSSIDFYILQKAINRNVHQAEAKVIETHTRKLEKPTGNAVR